jgi:hypothetical protein
MFTMQLRGRTVHVTKCGSEIRLLDERNSELSCRLTESEAEAIMQEAASHADAEFWSDAGPDEE